MFAGEHPTGATKTRGHLVDNQNDPVSAADVTQGLYIDRRLRPHSRGALHQRFHDQGRKVVFLLKDLLLGFLKGCLQGLLPVHPVVVAKDMGGDLGVGWKREAGGKSGERYRSIRG